MEQSNKGTMQDNLTEGINDSHDPDIIREDPGLKSDATGQIGNGSELYPSPHSIEKPDIKLQQIASKAGEVITGAISKEPIRKKIITGASIVALGTAGIAIKNKRAQQNQSFIRKPMPKIKSFAGKTGDKLNKTGEKLKEMAK